MTHTFPHPPTKLSQAKKESFGKWKRPASPPSTWQRRLRSFLIAWVIWLIRLFIDGFCARLQFVIELGLRMTIRRSVKVRHHHYGKGWREVVDIITTDQVALDDNSKPAIVYIHGGGWMIVSKDLMRPYVTYMARKGGYRVFNADYPLSPETKFPDALISVLRLLHWMRTKHNVDRVILMGDSAGANMCAMAGMLLHHPEFMAKLAAQIRMPQLATWQFPKIERNLFFYGLFDEESLHETRTAAAYVCREVLHMHRREEVFNGRCTPMDFINDYMDSSFPRTCIVTGTIDPLYPSNIKLYEILKNRGVKSELKIFHGQVHGFHSFFWSWERYDAQAFVLEHLQT